MDRYERQAKLREIGPAGQARVARACIEVALDGLAGETAVRYLAGAGVGRLRVTDEALAQAARAVDAAVQVDVVSALGAARGGEIEAMPGAFDLRDAAAREVARGALAALRALRRVLDGGEAAR
jgi:hypothetical protein